MQTQTVVLFFALAFVCTLFPAVSAHGYVKAIAIDGQWYSGSAPGGNAEGPSPIRLVSDIGPVKGATNPDIVCGLSAQKAAMVVPANPGSVLSIQWSGGNGAENWPHQVGPLMTYMASCGSTSCDQFDPTGATWFKIDQLGQKPGGSSWYQADVANGDSIDMTLPQNLSPGGYLVRHEIISLQGAVSVGGAEFYPMCAQIMIGGSGSGSPSPTVSFPGAYSDNDPGIYVPQIFNGPFNYTFPGGPVANLAATDASMASPWTGPTVFPSGTAVPAAPSPTAQGAAPSASGASPAAAAGSGSAAPAPASDGPAPTPTGASTSDPGSGGSCMLKARENAGSSQKRHLRRFSRRAAPHAVSH